eukprot:8999571-Karenia_brevis.AAC.1
MSSIVSGPSARRAFCEQWSAALNVKPPSLSFCNWPIDVVLGATGLSEVLSLPEDDELDVEE